LLLDPAFLILIQANGEVSLDGEGANGADLAYKVNTAKWTAGVGLSLTTLTMTAIHLLNKPVPQAGTLVVDNRSLRFAPRLVTGVIVFLLCFADNLTPRSFITILVTLMLLTLIFEWAAGLEKGAQLLEPKKFDN
jgi:hypothetical protein